MANSVHPWPPASATESTTTTQDPWPEDPPSRATMLDPPPAVPRVRSMETGERSSPQPAVTTPPAANPEGVAVFKTKQIQFLGRSTRIITENPNVPCPLIAICNVLLLRGEISPGEVGEDISLSQLITLLYAKIIDSVTLPESKDSLPLDLDQNVRDALHLLPSLATRLNVDPKFQSIDDFVLTKELSIFRALKVPIHHGWVIDPQDIDTVAAIGSRSFDELTMDLLVYKDDYLSPSGNDFSNSSSNRNLQSKSAGDRQEERELKRAVNLSKSYQRIMDNVPASNFSVGILAENNVKGQLIKSFLENSPSQLTTYGLFCLEGSLMEKEPCVLFRNNHFNTIFKLNGQLYLLATDNGSRDQPDTTWEILSQFNGKSHFLDDNIEKQKADYLYKHQHNEQCIIASNPDDLHTLEGSSPQPTTVRSEGQVAKVRRVHGGKLRSHTTIVVLPAVTRWLNGNDTLRKVERDDDENIPWNSPSREVKDMGSKNVFLGPDRRILASVSGNVEDGFKVCYILDEFLVDVLQAPEPVNLYVLGEMLRARIYNLRKPYWETEVLLLDPRNVSLHCEKWAYEFLGWSWRTIRIWEWFPKCNFIYE